MDLVLLPAFFALSGTPGRGAWERGGDAEPESPDTLQSSVLLCCFPTMFGRYARSTRPFTPYGRREWLGRYVKNHLQRGHRGVQRRRLGKVGVPSAANEVTIGGWFSLRWGGPAASLVGG